jgi:hypothetical protein
MRDRHTGAAVNLDDLIARAARYDLHLEDWNGT